ncbi:MAG: FprA family A-type flavoprotein [Planctomycetota bacterium]|jgi:flavorubredoxin|nr:FprA family A-type flavoprotein [Planctomycetota bacterium]
MRTSLCGNIDWVGAIDWNVRDFHSYVTDRGATYNSYLIRDRENAVIDPVKGPFFKRWLENIGKFVDPDSIRSLIINHAELDHSSALPMAVKAFPKAELVTNKKCRDTLVSYFGGEEWNWRLVKTGDEISLGSRTLRFIETPMVHWPDSMFTYVPEDGLLFSMDAFGQHFASSARFDDEVDFDIVMEEAKTYYANIVIPYGNFVRKAMAAAAGLDVRMIAPSHGLVWRSHAAEILAAYREWMVNRNRRKVIVFYDSMWDSTALIGEAILDGATVPGVETDLIHVRHANLTKIATSFMDAAAFAFGSATLNGLLMPTAAAALVYMEGMRVPNKAAFAFGSYGWAAKGGPDQVEEYLRRGKYEIIRPPLKCPYRPTPELLAEARQAGGELAGKALEAAEYKPEHGH